MPAPRRVKLDDHKLVLLDRLLEVLLGEREDIGILSIGGRESHQKQSQDRRRSVQTSGECHSAKVAFRSLYIQYSVTSRQIL